MPYRCRNHKQHQIVCNPIPAQHALLCAGGRMGQLTWKRRRLGCVSSTIKDSYLPPSTRILMRTHGKCLKVTSCSKMQLGARVADD